MKGWDLQGMTDQVTGLTFSHQHNPSQFLRNYFLPHLMDQNPDLILCRNLTFLHIESVVWVGFLFFFFPLIYFKHCGLKYFSTSQKKSNIFLFLIPLSLQKMPVGEKGSEKSEL